MKTGRIPEKMTAYLRPPEQEKLGDGRPHSRWSFPPDRRETPGFSKFKCCPAFVVLSDSEAFNKSAMNWATAGGIQDKKDVVFIEFDNEPITDLRWVGIDSRSEGCVAYKVVTPYGWLVDLREDVVLDCLYEGTITQKKSVIGSGTYITSEFVWAVIGSQSRLVRVASKVYEELMVSQIFAGMGPIPDKDLEVGGVYQRVNGKQVVLIDKGTEKGKRFLIEEVSSYLKVPIQDQVKGSISVLDFPNCLPIWHWVGSIKVVQQVGQVEVPVGIGERYDKKVAAIRKSATTWNRATSQ